MAITKWGIRTPEADDPWGLITDFQEFAYATGTIPREVQVGKCSGCGSSDFKLDKCLYCRQYR